MRIYIDLDNTLVNPVTDILGSVLAILPRPGAEEFLSKLSRDGDIWLLTAATRGHANNALDVLAPVSRKFRGIISIEDMEPVKEQLDVILNDQALTVDDQVHLWNQIRPLFPPGVMFDDYPVGSWMYLLKAASLGIPPDKWIQVEHFGNGKADNGGLKKAYAEFRKRFPNLLYMDGTQRRRKPRSGTMQRA